jgi:hypothetical protein
MLAALSHVRSPADSAFAPAAASRAAAPPSAASASGVNRVQGGKGDAAQADAAASGKVDQAQADELRKLKARDAAVRAHEQAHAATGGAYAGAPSFEYQRGPDGRNYAVGGEVPIDVSAVPGDPEATIRKMQQVQRAALAPPDPSGADRAVAATAAAMILTARSEQATEDTNRSESSGSSDAVDMTSGAARALAGDAARESLAALQRRTAGVAAYDVASARDAGRAVDVAS